MASSSPRRQHYDFAHRLLPKLLTDSPDRVLDILAGDQGASFIEQMWRYAGDGVPAEQRIVELPVRHIRRIGHDRLAVVLVMPAPSAITEAHLVAVVANAPDKGARYFTLELGVDFPEETPRTVFCEWNAGGHVNMGSGPAAEVAAFVDRIEALVSTRQ